MHTADRQTQVQYVSTVTHIMLIVTWQPTFEAESTQCTFHKQTKQEEEMFSAPKMRLLESNSPPLDDLKIYKT